MSTIRCPQCGTVFEHGAGRACPGCRSAPPLNAPGILRPPPPVERETKRDMGATEIIALCILAMGAGSLVLSLVSGGHVPMLPLLLLAAGGIVFLIEKARRQGVVTVGRFLGRGCLAIAEHLPAEAFAALAMLALTLLLKYTCKAPGMP